MDNRLCYLSVGNISLLYWQIHAWCLVPACCAWSRHSLMTNPLIGPWLVLSPPFSYQIQDVGQFARKTICLCRYSGRMHRGWMRLEYIAKNCPTRTSLNLNFPVEVALLKKSDYKLANETSCSAECLRFWWTESSSSCLLFTKDKARFKACGHKRM